MKEGSRELKEKAVVTRCTRKKKERGMVKYKAFTMIAPRYARTRRSIAFLYLFLAVAVAQITLCFSTQVYVVYMGSKNGKDPDQITNQHHQILAYVHSGSIEEAQALHVYSYKYGFRGFAEKLTKEQASQISSNSA